MVDQGQAEATQELDASQRLTSDIFKEGTLINVTIGFWEGKVRQDAKDVEITHSDLDNNVYTPGFKWLIPEKYTRPFGRFRSRLNSVMDRMSFKVPGMRGSRFVPKGAYPAIRQFLVREKELFFAECERFIEIYPDVVKEQKDLFNARYPEHTGVMDQLYPPASIIKDKFSYSWTPYSWAHTEIAEIARDAKEQLEERSRQLVYDSAIQIRQHIIDATESVVNAIQKGKNTVNIRAVSAFSQRLCQLKQLNLFNDPEIDKILKGATDTLSSVSSWKKEDIDETDIESKLSDMVRSLKSEVTSIEGNPEEFLVSRRVIEAIELDEDTELEVDIVRQIDTNV